MTLSHRSRSSSPTRRSNTPLPDIPEAPTPTHTVTPGPNAFAQQAARWERHRYEGNAFYQQEINKRIATPPGVLHPALRPQNNLTISARREQPEMLQLRDSTVTTMSPFINHGKESSPPLKLVPSPRTQDEAWPTRRGYLEERSEQRLHDASGDENDRTPVYTYTPKMDNSESGKFDSLTPKKRGAVDAATTSEQPKSPRKGLFGMLRKNEPRPTPPARGSSLSNNQTQKVPPKAKAVLGNSPPKITPARSPSKKKNLFSRKTTEPSGSESFMGGFFRKSTTTESQPLIVQGKTPPTASTATFSNSDSMGKTPQSAHSSFPEPVHDNKHQLKRAPSKTHSDTGSSKEEAPKCGVSRSQSLQYFDRNVPPTPPAKNTPPHEKTVRVENERITRKPLPYQRMFQDDTPIRETMNAIDPEGRISPTKFGDYGRKEVPMIVKRPSVYSMHGSVYPDFSDASSFLETKARVDGLGLEGLSQLPESYYSRNAEVTYSPSVYSTDWGAKASSSCYGSPLVDRDGKFKQSPSMPAIYERHRMSNSDGTNKTKASSSSNGTIPMVYPELASDPSRTNLTASTLDNASYAQTTYEVSEGIMPFHGSTHSRDHSNSPRHSNVSLFSKSAEDIHMSPTLYNCPSAMPSPLQYLPATVYTPPARKKKAMQADKDKNQQMTSPLAKHNTPDEVRSGSFLKRHSNLFDNAPTFPVRVDTAFDTVSSGYSPRNSISSHSRSDNEPQKPRSNTPATSNASQPPFDKLDQALALISGMAADKTQDMARMRDELRTMTALLDERLAASENLHESDGPDPYIPNGPLTGMASFHRSNAQHRIDVPTMAEVTQTFTQRYLPNASEREAEAFTEGRQQPSPTESNAVEQLIEVVGSMARRMQMLEARLGNEDDADANGSVVGSKAWPPMR